MIKKKNKKKIKEDKISGVSKKKKNKEKESEEFIGDQANLKPGDVKRKKKKK